MTIRLVAVQRFSVVSGKSFNDVVKSIDAAIGHPDMNKFRSSIAGAATVPELESVVSHVVGQTNLMEFARFDLGEVLQKYQGTNVRRSLRLVAGNPLIMKKMVEHVPDAGSYAPVTILIDERADGVHVSYDRMASYLAPYENAEAMQEARDLDAKVEKLLTEAAG
jgi:uncharacterized protein (DUF302 family)